MLNKLNKLFIMETHVQKLIIQNLTFSRSLSLSRRIETLRSYSSRKFYKNDEELNNLKGLITKYRDKLLYSSYLESKRLKFGFKRNAVIISKQIKEEKKKCNRQSSEPLAISLKYCTNVVPNNKLDTIEKNEHLPTDFPFQKTDVSITPIDHGENTEFCCGDSASLADIEIKSRLQLLKNNPNNWMTDYENYNDQILENDEMKINYGSPDFHSKVSNVPCGGCGALLHCKDTSIPGYVPSEIFKNHDKKGGINLKGMICQRCHFLRKYNLALQVRVSQSDYPEVLKAIRRHKTALVILIIDLLDFPCSIWPGIADLLGRGRPIFIIGNKIDLLPQDGKGFLSRVSASLENSVREAGFGMTDIKHISLISAKTGFGVEDLITKLHSFWNYKGDVFLTGCTNVGKSSLFNALLQSDYCKAQAVDLIQRATTSLWPGTTLNLLKFPIMRPTGWKLYVRSKRLSALHKLQSRENKLRRSQLQHTKNLKYATLIGHIDRTFSAEEPVQESEDLFSLNSHTNTTGINKVGIDENDEIYAMSKWCYDTPGVVQPNQIIHLLTTDELMLTLPKELIKPQTFKLTPGTSIFVGGLGRLDYIEGMEFARFTVFCSASLPITICQTDVADDIYKEFLGTAIFAVPIGNPERLRLWPGLKCKREYTVKGIDWEFSCGDVVLSNAGWIAIACGPELECKLKAWLPEKDGVYLRDSLLPKTVSLRGKKIRDSPAYKTDKFYVQM